MKSTPLPNWLIIGNSAIIIGISAALVGLAIGLITVFWNPTNVMGGLALLPFPLAVGSLQYAAGFRRNARAATVVGVTHLSACGFFGFACISTTIEWGLEKSFFSRDICTLLFILFCTSLYCGFCGWMNLRMRKYLRTAAAEGGLPDAASGLRRFQFTLRELLEAIVVVSIVASSASYIFRTEGKQYEEHITREASATVIAQLPEGATDVCYGQDVRGLLSYEFTIDEAGFLEWAENQLDNSPSNTANSIDKIQKGGPFTIERYTDRMPEPSSNEDETATITQGYSCEWSKGDEGFKLAYDSAKQRAYFYRY